MVGPLSGDEEQGDGDADGQDPEGFESGCISFRRDCVTVDDGESDHLCEQEKQGPAGPVEAVEDRCHHEFAFTKLWLSSRW